MPLASDLLGLMRGVRLLPRRMLLDTPGIEATVPMLRGVWGAALHGLDPVAYRQVFDPPADVAAGYVLRPAPPDPATAPALDWLLIGDAARHDRSLLRAWDFASGKGLGAKRQPFFVRILLPLRPDGRVGGPDEAQASWCLADAVWPLPGTPESMPCRLRFQAPLRLLRKGRLIERPALPDVVVAAARRVRRFLPAERQADAAQLGEAALAQAHEIRAGAWNGHRLDLERYSGRQKTDLVLRGVAGSIDLPAGPGPLWPLLAAAGWLHLGKGTVMGLGQLDVEPLQ